MSSRLSRPRRTKLYDCNYNMSERYYKPMVDHLDRKYTAGPTSPTEIPRHFSPLADGLRRREPTPDEPRRRPLSTMMEDLDLGGRSNGHSDDSPFSDEMSASMRRIAASKAARAAIEEEISEIENMRSNRKQARDFDYGDKMLDSVGLNGSAISRAQRSMGDETISKRRTLMMSSEDDGDNSTITKWTALKGAGQRMVNDMEDDLGSTAMIRARQSRNRLADLDAEMEQVADRAAAREKRNNHLRQLVQESANCSEASSATVRVKKTTVKSEKKMVSF